MSWHIFKVLGIQNFDLVYKKNLLWFCRRVYLRLYRRPNCLLYCKA